MVNRAQAYAVAAATVAVVISLISIGVVARRSAKAPESAQVTVEATVAAADVVKLGRESVEAFNTGVRMKDVKLAATLGLQTGDVITMIGGHLTSRDSDVHEAMQAASMFGVDMIDVDVVRGDAKLLLRWRIDGNLRRARRDLDSSRTPSTPTPSIDPLAGPAYGGSLTARDPALDTIKKTDDDRYEIPRSTIDRVLANPMDFAKGARVVPAMKNGKPDGFKLYAIRPNSIYGSLGFENGDTLKAVNGFELTSADKALEIYTKVSTATSLEVEIERRGRPVTLKYDIN